MKTALVGNDGYISGFILNHFSEERQQILKIGKNNSADVYLDLKEAEKFNYSSLDDIEYVIFTAAISNPDICAINFEFCWDINVRGTIYFIREAIKRKCHVLFFSSDAVFGSDFGMIYNEESMVEAVTPYGRMKKEVEEKFKNNSLFKAIRLSYVVSARDRFVNYCLNCIRKSEIAEIFHPFYRNVITVSDVVESVIFFSKNWDKYEPTFLNLAGNELVSRVRIADEINRCFGNKLKYIISFPGEDFFLHRPRITQMRSLYMRQYGIVTDDTFTEKISRELKGIEL